MAVLFPQNARITPVIMVAVELFAVTILRLLSVWLGKSVLILSLLVNIQVQGLRISWGVAIRAILNMNLVERVSREHMVES